MRRTSKYGCVEDARFLPAFAFLETPAPTTPAIGNDDENARDQRASSSSSHVVSVKQPSAWSYCGPLLPLQNDDDDTTSGNSLLDALPASFGRWLNECISVEERRSNSGDRHDDNGSGKERPQQQQQPSPPSPLLTAFQRTLARANAFLTANGLTHYWITVRATQPDDEFARPRWHTDDFFFERYLNDQDGEDATARLTAARRPFGERARWLSSLTRQRQQRPTDWKLVCTLVGPRTLFVGPAWQARAREAQRSAKVKCGKEHLCESVRCVGCSTAASQVREVMEGYVGGLLVEEKKREEKQGLERRIGRETEEEEVVGQPALGELTFLRVGHERGAVHSEPDLLVDRVFVNIVPGKREELEGLMAKWGMGFPRDWVVVEGGFPS